jgi:hypothetical protein
MAQRDPSPNKKMRVRVFINVSHKLPTRIHSIQQIQAFVISEYIVEDAGGSLNQHYTSSNTF